MALLHFPVLKCNEYSYCFFELEKKMILKENSKQISIFSVFWHLYKKGESFNEAFSHLVTFTLYIFNFLMWFVLRPLIWRKWFLWMLLVVGLGFAELVVKKIIIKSFTLVDRFIFFFKNQIVKINFSTHDTFCIVSFTKAHIFDIYFKLKCCTSYIFQVKKMN